jgi:hypothetical protein
MSAQVRRVWRASLVTAVATVAIGIGVSAQQADDVFRRGIQARDDRQWQQMAQRMREAIALRQQESTDKIGARLGFGGTEYLPYYFLGEALFRQGDCAGAINAWTNSERQGIVQKVRDGEFIKFLRNGYLECEKKGVLATRLEPELQRVYAQIESVNKLLASIGRVADANIEVWRGESAIREQYDRGRAELDTAATRYEAARTSRALRDIEAATAAVERARPILERVETGFRASLDSRQSAQALVREVGEAINAAEALNGMIEGRKVPFSPAMTTSLQDGRDALGRARDRLAEAQKTMNPQTLAVARTSATDAQNRFRQLLEEIGRIEKDAGQRQVSEALTRTLEAFSLMDTAAATLDRYTSQKPGLLPADKEAERQAVQEQVSRARRRLDQARRSDNVAVIADAAKLAIELRDRLTQLIAAFGPLTLRDRGVHEALEQGARQYFNGEYQQAVASLAAGETVAEDVALRLHFHLLRAAALYELFLRSHGKDQALQAQALEEVQHAKSIDSAFQPEGRAFSPRFITFYQGVTALSAAPAAAPQP